MRNRNPTNTSRAYVCLGAGLRRASERRRLNIHCLSVKWGEDEKTRTMDTACVRWYCLRNLACYSPGCTKLLEFSDYIYILWKCLMTTRLFLRMIRWNLSLLPGRPSPETARTQMYICKIVPVAAVDAVFLFWGVEIEGWTTDSGEEWTRGASHFSGALSLLEKGKGGELSYGFLWIKFVMSLLAPWDERYIRGIVYVQRVPCQRSGEDMICEARTPWHTHHTGERREREVQRASCNAEGEALF